MCCPLCNLHKDGTAKNLVFSVNFFPSTSSVLVPHPLMVFKHLYPKAFVVEVQQQLQDQFYPGLLVTESENKVN